MSAIDQLQTYEAYCQGRLADPYPLFHRLRAEDPVHWSQKLDSWMLTRYDDVLAANRDGCLSSDRVAVNMSPLTEAQRVKYAALKEHVANWLGFTDPPKHTRMRHLISQSLTAKRADDMRGHIEQIATGLLDQVAGKGRMDLVRDFAYPLPATVILHILGIPDRNRQQCRQWIEDLIAFVGGVGPSLAQVADRAEQSQQALTRFFRDLTLKRRNEPQEDLISDLAAVEGQPGGLTEQELLGLCVFLFAAGHETTVGLIANGMLALLQHRHEMERLRHDRTLMPTAIEEFLRYESPIQIDTRLAKADLQIAGQHIASGQTVIMVRAAANRDPAQFADPDRLDVGRKQNKHLAFGWGAHFCLGAPLARLEGQIAIRTLLDRFDKLQMETGDIQWLANMSVRCPQSMPVTF